MRAHEFIVEDKKTTTVRKLYDNQLPDRDEEIWNHIRPGELDLPLDTHTLSAHKLKIMLLSQYRVEHVDEIVDLLKRDQRKIVKKYISDPQLSDQIIVVSDDRIVDGNHRALAAVLSNRGIKYVDLAELDESINESEQHNLPRLIQDHGRSDDYLKNKRQYAIERGRNDYGVPYMSSTTGYFKSNVMVPVDILRDLPGMRGEQQNVRHSDLRAIMKIMRDTGKLPLTNSGEEYAPYIMVAYNGEAWVNEGNHRIMAADRLGWDSLPVELKYFDGGDTVDGPLAPQRLRQLGLIA